VGVVDRGAVGAVRCDVAVLVQQIHPRDADVVEHDAAVVDAGQAALVLAVRRRDPGQVVAVGVADRDQYTMHAVVDLLAVFGGDQLRENRCHGGRLGGATDVVLAGRRGGGVDDEFFGAGVVGRGGLHRLDVAAVPGLGHGETV